MTKIYEKELKKINERMQGWTIDSVQSGTSAETVFIINLSKGKNKRVVKLGANDLGGWLA